MCLYANLKLHGNGIAFAPKIAKVPLLVWKSLEAPNEDSAYSPFRFHRWFFGRAETAELDIGRLTAGVIEVTNGLHAHVLSVEQRKIPAVVRRYTGRDRNLWDIHGKLYPAVIPAGTKFVLGMDGDIVCEAMTVYRNKTEMFKALGITKLAPGVNHSHIAEW